MRSAAATSAREVKRGTHVLTVVSLVLAMAWAGALPAYAQPNNDNVEGAIPIELPFSGEQDTSQATTDDLDAELNSECGWNATDASVWYRFTPDEDSFVEIFTGESDYSVGVMVAAQFDGELFGVSCDEALFASAETTYLIVVFDSQEDGEGDGGNLVLEVVAEPLGPPPEIDLTIDPIGVFHKDGSAMLSGTVTCNGDADFIGGFADLRQSVGRFTISGLAGLFDEGGHDHGHENGSGDGNGEPAVSCDGTTQSWSAHVHADNGLFRGGRATVEAFVSACGFIQCGEVSVTQTVRLRRG